MPRALHILPRSGRYVPVKQDMQQAVTIIPCGETGCGMGGISSRQLLNQDNLCAVSDRQRIQCIRQIVL